MHLLVSSDPGMAVEGPSTRVRRLARAEPRGSCEDQPAIVEFLERKVETDYRVLSALLRLEAARIGPDRMEARNAFDEARSRILTTARIQNCFAQHAGRCQISFAGYLSQACEDASRTLASPTGPTLSCEASKTTLPASSAIRLGLVAGELIILAFRYGYWSGRGGRVHVAFSVVSAAWELVVEDTGTVMQGRCDGRVAGLAIVRNVVGQLGGALDIAKVIGGNRLTVTLPRS